MFDFSLGWRGSDTFHSCMDEPRSVASRSPLGLQASAALEGTPGVCASRPGSGASSRPLLLSQIAIAPLLADTETSSRPSGLATAGDVTAPATSAPRIWPVV